MILISHRGNINGVFPDLENKPSYIYDALNSGYQVEIDLWYDNGWWTGHDAPTFDITWHVNFLHSCWCHAKNAEALEKLSKISYAHYFWHQEDNYTLTSRGHIWTHVGQAPMKGAICVLPEKSIYPIEESKLKQCAGICSDVIQRYKKNE